MRNGHASERPMLERRIGGTGSSSWPTATVSRGRNSTLERQPGPQHHDGTTLLDKVRDWPTPDGHVMNDGERAETFFARRERLKAKGYNGNGAGVPLAMRAQVWNTPNTMDGLKPKSQERLEYEHDTARPGRTNPNNLRDQVNVAQGYAQWPTPKVITGGPENRASRARRGSGGEDLQATSQEWPTPQHRDWKSAHASEATATKNSRPLNEGPVSSPLGQTTETDGHTCSPKCRRLNPHFVAWLMGFPTGWLDFEPLETP
jgi:hypothetical protein